MPRTAIFGREVHRTHPERAAAKGPVATRWAVGSRNSTVPTLVDLVLPTSVVALTFIGFFKGSAWLARVPVDLTAALAALVVVISAGAVAAQGRDIKVPLWPAAFVAACVPALLYASGNPAVDDKRLRLLLPLVVAVATSLTVRGIVRQRIWVWLHVLVGVVLVAAGTTSESSLSRFAAAGSTTIAAGRASGVAVVALVVLLLSGGLRRWWLRVAAIVASVWLTTALIQTGSRGPAFACAATILIVAFVSSRRGRFLRTIAAIAATLAGWLMLADATGIGAGRITKSISGQYSLTGSRQDLWTFAVKSIGSHPFGVGWGNFYNVLPAWARLDSGYDQYPHNFVLEVFAEAGWAAGFAMIVVVAMSIRRLIRRSDQPYGAAILGIAVFFVLNALVSGDLNDNRMMWAALATAWPATSGSSTGPDDLGAERRRWQWRYRSRSWRVNSTRVAA